MDCYIQIKLSPQNKIVGKQPSDVENNQSEPAQAVQKNQSPQLP